MSNTWNPIVMKTYTEEGEVIRRYASISLDTGSRISIHPSAEDAFNCLLGLLKPDDRIDVKIFTHKLPYQREDYPGLSLHSFKTLAADHFPNHLMAVVTGSLPERRYDIWLQFHYSAGVRLHKLHFIRDSYYIATSLYREALTRFELLDKSLLENTAVKDIGKLAVYLKVHLKLLDITRRSTFSEEDINKLTRLYQQTKALVHRPFMMDNKPAGGYSDPITFIRMFHEQYGYPVMCPYTCGVKFVK